MLNNLTAMNKPCHIQHSMKPLSQIGLYSTPQRQKVEHFVQPPHLLIVDRDALFGSLLKKSLEVLGYEITLVYSGQAALHLLGPTGVDLVLLDPLLPDMDGYLLCAEIDRLYNTPLVIISQLNDIDKALRAFSAGASAIVNKPFRLQELATEVHKILNTASFGKGRHVPSLPEDPGEQVGRYAYSSDERY
jgi:DNA-binding response OmpR family regulator